MNPFSRGENRLSKEGHSREVTGLMVAQTASSAGGGLCRVGLWQLRAVGRAAALWPWWAGSHWIQTVMPVFKTPAHKASTPECLPWAVCVTCRTR